MPLNSNDFRDEKIKEFEQLFEENKQDRKNEEEQSEFRHKMRRNHIIAIAAYVFGMFFLSMLLAAIISFIPGATIEIDPSTQVVENVAINSNVIAFIKSDSYNNYQEKYSKYIDKVSYLDYYFLFSVYNRDSFYETFTVKEGEQFVVDEIAINQFIAGEIKTWEGKNEIILYYSNPGSITHPEFIDNFKNINAVLINESITDFSDGAGNTINFLVYLIVLAVVGYLLFPNIKKDLEPFIKRDKQAIIGIFTGVAIIYGAGLLATLLQQLLSIIMIIPGGESLNQISIDMSLRGAGAPLMILSAVIIGPLVEELIFRKAIFELSNNKWLGLVLSSIMFGLIHVTGEISNLAGVGHFIYVFIPYLAMGFGFGAAYIIFKENAITTTGTHMIWNLIAILASYFI